MTLVQDNLKAHKPAALYEVFEPERAKAILDKLEFVFTPSTALGSTRQGLSSPCSQGRPSRDGLLINSCWLIGCRHGSRSETKRK